MMRKIAGVALVVWVTIATAMLLWSIVGNAPWERQGRCLDAMLRFQAVTDERLLNRSFDSPISLGDFDTMMRYVIKARADMERWCR